MPLDHATPLQQTEAQDRQARHLRQLQHLAELGLRVADALAAHILADPAPPEPDAPNLPLAFARVCGAVRQAIALEARLAAPPPTRPASLPARQRTTLARIVEDSIRTQAPHDIDDLTAALHDRLADPDPDLAAAIARATPITLYHLAAALCDELGIPPDCATWPDEALQPPNPCPTPRALSPPAPPD